MYLLTEELDKEGLCKCLQLFALRYSRKTKNLLESLDFKCALKTRKQKNSNKNAETNCNWYFVNDNIAISLLQLLVYMFLIDKPEMKKNNTMEIKTWINHETDVHCEARGVPLPDIKWSRDGTVSSIVQSQSRVSTLKFTPKTLDDFGSLTCTATNQMGSTTQRVILIRLGKGEFLATKS